MATPVTLPALGESVTEGTVTRWLKQVGDTVAVDEPLLEVSTDKVDTEIPSPVAGTLLEIKVDEDETVEVGAELAVVGDKSDGDQGEDDDDAASASSSSSSEEGETGSNQHDAKDEQEQAEPAAEPEPEPSGDDAHPADQGDADSADAAEQPAPQADQKPTSGGTSVTLPALGESVTEGTVTRWLKQVGDTVAVDEPLLEVSTDKVDTEIPSPVAGTLLEIKVDEDETVEVGAELAVVGDKSDGGPSEGGDGSGSDESEQSDRSGATEAEPSGESKPPPEEKPEPEAKPKHEARPKDEQESKQEPAEAPKETVRTQHDPHSAPPKAEMAAAPTPPSSAASSGGGQGRAEDALSYVTPLVRKLAAQHDVELSSLTGSGVGGRIRKQDVLAAAEEAKAASAAEAEPAAAPATPAASAPSAPAPQVSPLRGKTENLSRLRKVIASRMVESLQVSAQLTTVVEVDVTVIARLRNRVKASFESREGVKLSFLPFFAKASIDALKTYPQVNSSIDTEAGTVTYHGSENLGVAVDTERGLLVPVIKDAGDLNIAGLARKIADVATRTRDNKITPDELSGGTFTLTNTGSRGALFDTPIINQPQVAILGTGSVVKRAVVIDDPNLGETIAVRNMVYLALTYDHRIVDGADAARFLTAVKERLEEGKFEAELGV
ncbi:MAG: 2-oxoglutarate dehydrogenase, E2 component, dihydrolipoamide succinyltransferase [Nocardioidaceae bacterium]